MTPVLTHGRMLYGSSRPTRPGEPRYLCFLNWPVLALCGASWGVVLVIGSSVASLW